MNELAIDKRIIKTKNRIKEALVLLMEKKDIKNITIVELSDNALINRKTFYLHYQDIESVLKEIEVSLVDKIRYLIKNYDLGFDKLKEFIYNILNTILNDKYVYKVLVSTKYGKSIVSILEKVIINDLLKKITPANKTVNNALKIEYSVYGSMELFYKWMKGSSVSFDDLVNFIYSTINKYFEQ